MSEKRRELSDDGDAVTTALYELEGAIRNAATNVVVGHSNWTDVRQREQTAATILAALILRLPEGQTVKYAEAVAIADALRAELAKDKP